MPPRRDRRRETHIVRSGKDKQGQANDDIGRRMYLVRDGQIDKQSATDNTKGRDKQRQKKNDRDQRQTTKRTEDERQTKRSEYNCCPRNHTKALSPIAVRADYIQMKPEACEVPQ